MASAIHPHRSAVGILMSTPLWKAFNTGILCSERFQCRSGHNIPLSPQQDKRFCLSCKFLSLYEWESVIPFKSRALSIVLVPQSHLTVTLEIVAHQAPCPWSSPGKNTRLCCHLLLQPWEWVLLCYKLMATFFYQRASMTQHREQSPGVRAAGTHPRGSQTQRCVALPLNGECYQLPARCSHLSSHQSHGAPA